MLVKGKVDVLNQKHTSAYRVRRMYFLDDPKGGVFCKRGSLYFSHQPYV